MSWSQGEIQGLAIKATRGAGFSWGLAEEAGFAVRWMESLGLPGCSALAAYLPTANTLHDTSRRNDLNAGKSCPLRIGARLMDQKTALPTELGNIHQPLLLLPFISSSAIGPCCLSWRVSRPASDSNNDDTLTVHIAEYKYHSEHQAQQLLHNSTACCISVSDNTQWQSPCCERVTQDRSDAVKVLAYWAGKTYAPATEASRMAGAGAGITDND